MALAANSGEHQQDTLPHRAIVEEVLGEPLLPQGVEYEVAGSDRLDIRVAVHDLVMSVVQKLCLGQQEPLDTGRYLTEEQHAQLQERDGELLLLAGRHVIIANNVAQSMDEPAFLPPGAEPPDTPRSLLQSSIGAKLYDFIQRPHPVRLPGGKRLGALAALQSGLLLVSATASGKTPPIAEVARRAGVGRPFSKRDPEQNRVLVVLPDQHLMQSYLDPDESLRRWLPGLEVSAFWQRSKEVGAPIQLVTDDSLPKALASGAIRLVNYPLRIVDEGHNAGAPKMLEELGELSTGRLILCTATPRHMRRYFVDFVASTPRSAAEQGITRPVRLLTYQYGPEAGGAETLTAKIAAKAIQAGKQVAIYCCPVRGRPDAQQARDVAQLINGMNLTVPEGLGWQGGDYVRVIAGVSGAAENEQAKADHKSGLLRGYVAVGMLREGVNMPMDVEIIVGPRYEQGQWQVDQIAGRLPRPGDGEGFLIEVQPRTTRRGKPLASIWRTYGFENDQTITQGHLVGAPEEGYDAAQPQEKGRASGVQIDPLAEGGATSGPKEQPSPPPERSSFLDTLVSADLGEFLAPAAPLRTVTIARPDWNKYEAPPVGSKPIPELATKYNVPEVWLRHQLDTLASGTALNITYVLVRNKDNADGGISGGYTRWYGPATEAYLDEHPPLALAEKEAMNRADIAAMCGVSKKFIESTIDRLALPHVDRLGKNHRPAKHYKMPEINKIIIEVAKIPVADPTEEALFDLAQELEENFVYQFARARRHGITVHERRRHPSTGKGFAGHVSAEDAARIRFAYHNPQLATKDDVSIAEMARQAGTDLGTMIRHINGIPEEERPDISSLKLGPKGRMADHMRREDALPIIEQKKVRQLSPDRVTLPMMDQYFDASRKTITYRIAALVKKGVLTSEEAQARPLNLGGYGGEVSTWPWRIMKVLEEAGMPLRDSAKRVDYTRVAQEPQDPALPPNRHAQYSQQVQRQFVDEAKLVKLPPPEWVGQSMALDQLHCSGIALSYLVAADGQLEGYLRKVEDSEAELHRDLLERVQRRLLRIKLVDEQWMQHGQLARQLQMSEAGLQAFMRRKGIGLGSGEAKVVRAFGAHTYYDVAYAPRVWHTVRRGASG